MAMMTIYHPVLSADSGDINFNHTGLLNLIVAIYLIATGLLGIIHGQNRFFSI